MTDNANFGHLVGVVVHDLKNQLQSLTDQQSRLLSEVPEEYHNLLFPMVTQTNQLKEDALRLVSLLRLEHHEHFPMDDCWPSDTACNAIESCRIQYPDLILNSHIDSEIQGFYNEQLIQLALVTLINNSAQAGATEVNLSCEEGDKGCLTFVIDDDGLGFEDEILSGEQTTTKEEGTGLGLTFVRMICEAHDSSGRQGQLTISNRDPGARVTITLP